MADTEKDKLEDRLSSVLEKAKPAPSEKQEENSSVSIQAGRDVHYVEVGGKIIIDRRKTIIINQARRSDDKITEQQQEIKERIDAIVKLDCVIDPALDPTDSTHFAERRNSSRRKRWNALRRRFLVKSYKDLTQNDYPKVIEWLDRQRDQKLAKINSPPNTKKGAGNGLRLLSIFIVSIAVLLSLSLVQIPAADPDHNDVTNPAIYKPPDLPNVITADLINNTRPLTVIRYKPGFQFFCGCSLIRAPQPQPIRPPAAKQPQSI